ncbi:glycosyltransferase [Trabulsiella odontotermitis]|uniref:glycosyltransferase n=1 Tax=Trabulsiella odontotermitis TaxID=379893 RepID=UPI003ACA365D
MRVLLVGEFSGVHRNLMEQLAKDGIHCDLLSDGDGWKGFNSTITIPKRRPIKGISKFLFPALDFFGLAGIASYLENRNIIDRLDKYEIIQFINPLAIKTFGAIGNLLLFSKLSKKSPKMFLCALGGDLCVETFYLSGKLKYSPWSNFNLKRIMHYYQNMSFFFPGHIALYFYVTRKVKAIIPGLYEYKKAYENNKKCTSIIGLPINNDEYRETTPCSGKPVRIFYSKKPHLGDYYKKGYKYFDEALKLLDERNIDYELITANGIPFSEYKALLAGCDILLDQTLSYDRGMSGVIGMASGMITFSGNEPDIEEYYDRKIPCINAEPDSAVLADKLIHIIQNYNDYNALRIASKKYIEKYHSSKVICSKYIDVWTKE